jgi:uncharacterized protein (UPF0332 family)
MTLDKTDKINLSNIRMEKADDFIIDAEENLKNGRYRTAINRSYYAILSASRSLLILEGFNPLSHEGIITMLSLHFVKKELLPVSIIKSYKKLYTMRTDADYGDFDLPSEEDAMISVSAAKEILAALNIARKAMM